MTEVSQSMGVREFVQRLRPLNLNQYDDAKATVLERVNKLIGDKPTRDSLKRDQGVLFTPLDILAVVVFFAAFLVSSVHIIHRMGEMANKNFAAQSANVLTYGLNIDGNVYTLAHQLGFIFLAEASMLLFMVTWRMQIKREKIEGRVFWNLIPRQIFSVYLALALVAMAFVLIANAASGLNFLEALMPPVFTIGLGFHVEHLIVELLERRDDLNSRLVKAMNTWDQANEDPTTHPEYRKLLMRELWEKLSKLAANRELADVPAQYKLAAVHREMERDVWTDVAVVTETKVASVAQQLGVTVEVAENLVLNEGGLMQLAEMVKEAPEGLIGESAIITTPAGSANLELMTWTDAGQGGREYGPYTRRSMMAAAIRSVAKTNTRRQG